MEALISKTAAGAAEELLPVAEMKIAAEIRSGVCQLTNVLVNPMLQPAVFRHSQLAVQGKDLYRLRRDLVGLTICALAQTQYAHFVATIRLFFLGEGC